MSLPKSYGIARGWPLGPGQSSPSSGTPTPTPTPTVGTLLGGFETTTDWTPAAGYTVTLDPVRKVQGQYSARHVPSTALSNVRTYKDFPGFDMQNLGAVAFYTALDDDYDWQNASAVSGSALVNATGTIYTIAGTTQLSLYSTGGLWHAGSFAQAPAGVKAAGVGTHRFQVVNTLASAKINDISFDAFYHNVGGIGGVMLTFDDAYVDAIDCLAIMQPLGIVGEAYIPTAQIGTANKFSWVQAAQLKAGGWNIQLDGTTDDGAFTNLANPAAGVAALAAGKAELITRGLGTEASLNAFCYPFGIGGARTNGTRTEKASVTTLGATVTMADTAGITVGMRFVCMGAKRTNRVQSVAAGTVTLDEPVDTAVTALPAAFIDDSGPFHGKKLQNAIRAAGWKWGRSTYSGRMFVQYGISPDMAIEFPATSASGLTLATFQTAVQAAIDNKQVLAIYCHTVRATGAPGVSLNWDITEFQACMNWLKTQIDAGVVESVTTASLDQKYGNRTVPT